MKKLGVTLAILGLIGAAGQVHAADVLKKISTNTTINGKFTNMGKTEVTIEKTTGATETVPVNDIDWLSFDGEPTMLKTIRTQSINGSYSAALTNLAKIDPDSASRPEVKQEIDVFACLLPRQAGHGNRRHQGNAGLPARRCMASSRIARRAIALSRPTNCWATCWSL